MPYCPSCGVELAPEAESCPLCRMPNLLGLSRAGRERAGADSGCAESDPHGGPDLLGVNLSPGAEDAGFTLPERRKIAWEVLTVAAGVAVLTLGAINFLESGRLSWSLYPLSSLAFVWLVASSFLMLDRYPPADYIIAALSLPAFLLALDAIEGGLSWSFELAVPIALIVELSGAGVVAAIRSSRRKGLNLVAYALVGVAIVCLGVEASVDLYVEGRIAMSWSSITALALVPMAMFLIYLHSRVLRTTNLRRLFRL
jgi:hypothetical protein